MSFVDELENSIDMVEFVGRYTKLKKTGANYKALCPFPGHNEKTPSFVVSPVKQIGYCFGCHKGGGPVKFVMDMENCEFREALQIIGNITGKEIPGYTENKQEIQIRKNLYSLFKDAANYYKEALKNNLEAKKYLSDRDILAEDIESFHFGYSDSGVSLYNYLKDKGYEDTLIAESNIFLDLRTKKDKFIGRIIFPIQNLRGDFVGFAGRILGSGEPKYLNSPASKIYDKSSILYGLYAGKNTIIKNDRIIITEGYMDTIALHKYGYKEAVAVSGTALTEKHIPIIKRLTHKIYLCFDSDKAGVGATRNSLEILKNNDFEVRIISLNGAKDPDEYLAKGGDFETCIKNAISPIAFEIESNNRDLSSIDEKKKFMSEVLIIVRDYSDPVERDTYLKEIATLTNTPESVVYEMYKQIGQPRKKQTQNREKNYIPSSEDILIANIGENISLGESIKKGLLFIEGTSQQLQSALEEQKAYYTNLSLDKKNLYKALHFDTLEKYPSEEEYASYIDKTIHSVNIMSYKRMIEKLKSEIQSGNTESLQTYQNLLQIAKEHHLK